MKHLKYTPLGRWLTLPLRLRICAQHFLPQLGMAARWLLTSREWTNFSLNYSDAGLASMNATVATLLGLPHEQVEGYTREFLANSELSERLAARRQGGPLRYVTDGHAYRGKCLLNYVLTRACRARTVFEAGTAQGLSAVCIAEALRLNARESGHAGRLYTVDLTSDRSLYLSPRDQDVVSQLTGDSIEQVEKFDHPIDLFLHDTINDPRHTTAQLTALMTRLAPRGVIHTSWFSDAFVGHCRLHGLNFLPFTEATAGHWYPGRRAGLAVAPARP